MSTRAGVEPSDPAEPPGDLAQRQLPLTEITGPLYRGHKRNRHPAYFNSARGRFAPPDGTGFGVMYLGTTDRCPFIEMFDFASDFGFGISEEIVQQSCLCPVELHRPLRIVDLTTGPNLKRLAPYADNRICDGSHTVSQRWASAFWMHPDQIDGILYRARNAPELFSVALFDRVAAELITDCTRSLLQDEHALAALLDYFECPLVP